MLKLFKIAIPEGKAIRYRNYCLPEAAPNLSLETKTLFSIAVEGSKIPYVKFLII